MNPHGRDIGRSRSEEQSGPAFIELRFNVNTCSFSVVKKSLPSGLPWEERNVLINDDLLDPDAHFLIPSWNDQITLVVEVTRGQTIDREALTLPRHFSLVAMPVCRSTIRRWSDPICVLRKPGSSHVASNLHCVTRMIALQRHMKDRYSHGPETTPSDRGPVLEVFNGEDQPFALRPSASRGFNMRYLHSCVYAKSDFVMDLTDIFSSGGDDGNNDAQHWPYQVFQDDHFIVLFHRHGYIAWDFRTETSPGCT